MHRRTVMAPSLDGRVDNAAAAPTSRVGECGGQAGRKISPASATSPAALWTSDRTATTPSPTTPSTTPSSTPPLHGLAQLSQPPPTISCSSHVPSSTEDDSFPSWLARTQRQPDRLAPAKNVNLPTGSHPVGRLAAAAAGPAAKMPRRGLPIVPRSPPLDARQLLLAGVNGHVAGSAGVAFLPETRAVPFVEPQLASATAVFPPPQDSFATPPSRQLAPTWPPSPPSPASSSSLLPPVTRSPFEPLSLELGGGNGRVSPIELHSSYSSLSSSTAEGYLCCEAALRAATGGDLDAGPAPSHSPAPLHPLSKHLPSSYSLSPSVSSSDARQPDSPPIPTVTHVTDRIMFSTDDDDDDDDGDGQEMEVGRRRRRMWVGGERQRRAALGLPSFAQECQRVWEVVPVPGALATGRRLSFSTLSESDEDSDDEGGPTAMGAAANPRGSLAAGLKAPALPPPLPVTYDGEDAEAQDSKKADGLGSRKRSPSPVPGRRDARGAGRRSRHPHPHLPRHHHHGAISDMQEPEVVFNLGPVRQDVMRTMETQLWHWIEPAFIHFDDLPPSARGVAKLKQARRLDSLELVLKSIRETLPPDMPQCPRTVRRQLAPRLARRLWDMRRLQHKGIASVLDVYTLATMVQEQEGSATASDSSTGSYLAQPTPLPGARGMSRGNRHLLSSFMGTFSVSEDEGEEGDGGEDATQPSPARRESRGDREGEVAEDTDSASPLPSLLARGGTLDRLTDGDLEARGWLATGSPKRKDARPVAPTTTTTTRTALSPSHRIREGGICQGRRRRPPPPPSVRAHQLNPAALDQRRTDPRRARHPMAVVRVTVFVLARQYVPHARSLHFYLAQAWNRAYDEGFPLHPTTRTDTSALDGAVLDPAAVAMRSSVRCGEPGTVPQPTPPGRANAETYFAYKDHVADFLWRLNEVLRHIHGTHHDSPAGTFYHGNLKPKNIFLHDITKDVYVTDMGLNLFPDVFTDSTHPRHRLPPGNGNNGDNGGRARKRRSAVFVRLRPPAAKSFYTYGSPLPSPTHLHSSVDAQDGEHDEFILLRHLTAPETLLTTISPTGGDADLWVCEDLRQPASDMYVVGVLLYMLLLGRYPPLPPHKTVPSLPSSYVHGVGEAGDGGGGGGGVAAWEAEAGAGDAETDGARTAALFHDALRRELHEEEEKAGLDPLLVDILAGLLHPIPASRWSADELAEHALFRAYGRLQTHLREQDAELRSAKATAAVSPEGQELCDAEGESNDVCRHSGDAMELVALEELEAGPAGGASLPSSPIPRQQQEELPSETGADDSVEGSERQEDAEVSSPCLSCHSSCPLPPPSTSPSLTFVMDEELARYTFPTPSHQCIRDGSFPGEEQSDDAADAADSSEDGDDDGACGAIAPDAPSPSLEFNMFEDRQEEAAEGRKAEWGETEQLPPLPPPTQQPQPGAPPAALVEEEGEGEQPQRCPKPTPPPPLPARRRRSSSVFSARAPRGAGGVPNAAAGTVGAGSFPGTLPPHPPLPAPLAAVWWVILFLAKTRHRGRYAALKRSVALLQQRLCCSTAHLPTSLALLPLSERHTTTAAVAPETRRPPSPRVGSEAATRHSSQRKSAPASMMVPVEERRRRSSLPLGDTSMDSLHLPSRRPPPRQRTSISLCHPFSLHSPFSRKAKEEAGEDSQCVWEATSSSSSNGGGGARARQTPTSVMVAAVTGTNARASWVKREGKATLSPHTPSPPPPPPPKLLRSSISAITLLPTVTTGVSSSFSGATRGKLATPRKPAPLRERVRGRTRPV